MSDTIDTLHARVDALQRDLKKYATEMQLVAEAVGMPVAPAYAVIERVRELTALTATPPSEPDDTAMLDELLKQCAVVNRTARGNFYLPETRARQLERELAEAKAIQHAEKKILIDEITAHTATKADRDALQRRVQELEESGTKYTRALLDLAEAQSQLAARTADSERLVKLLEKARNWVRDEFGFGSLRRTEFVNEMSASIAAARKGAS